jgi:DNA topoisomerase-1
MQWTAAMREFYVPFAEDVKKAQAEMPVVKTGPEPIGRACPEDSGELVIRYGRYGKFISCANFPTCRYTEPWLEKIGVKCPKDGGEIVERKTRKGRTSHGCINIPMRFHLLEEALLREPSAAAAGDYNKRAQCRLPETFPGRDRSKPVEWSRAFMFFKISYLDPARVVSSCNPDCLLLGIGVASRASWER